MILFPNCKINLGLNITQKRSDGYHNLETVFYPIPLTDAIEVVPAAAFNFTASGLPVAGDNNSNLCVKAWQLLKKHIDLPPVHLYLHKVIPMGAGLGGGSADGAFMLQLLNEKFQLQLTTEQLMTYAARLGSDCPFFINNSPAFAGSRGEVMEPVALDLSNYSLVVVYPGIHINTAWAFSKISPAAPSKSIKTIIVQPIETWRKELVNDFEKPVCEEYPALKTIKDQLYQSGAIYASMTGSGSGFFGIFARSKVPADTVFPGYFFRIL